MEKKIEVTSTEIVKPSSPTPAELKTLKLSFLDQAAPGSYTPLLFFYRAVQLDQNSVVDHSERSNQLKKSLADTLTRFYPLAGTMVEGYLVDCNDEGAEYSEARVSCDLSEVIDNDELDFKFLHKLLPFEPFADLSESGSRDFILSVRYNIFNCGGIAVAVCVTHKLVDGTSATTFVKEWAATSRGVSECLVPTFDAAKLFPPSEIKGFQRPSKIEKDTIVSKRFVFSKAKIDALKDEFSVALEKPPTRVEAISAFIWKRFMAIARAKPQKTKVSAALHAVNVRGRMDPTLPAHSLGNIWWFAIAPCPIDEERDHQFLILLIRKAIREIDSEFVKTLQDSEKALGVMRKVGQQMYSGEVEFYSFTSWCRFPLYEADFGWGKPAWVCSPSRPFKNVVVLMPTSGDGDGIEAWVNLDEEGMTAFQRDPELLSLTS